MHAPRTTAYCSPSASPRSCCPRLIVSGDRTPSPSSGHRRGELVVELVDERARRPGGAVGQAADRRAGHDAHGLFQLHEHVEVLAPAAAVDDAVEDLAHPRAAFAAGRALAAAFVGVEPHAVRSAATMSVCSFMTIMPAVPRPRQPPRKRTSSKSSLMSS